MRQPTPKAQCSKHARHPTREEARDGFPGREARWDAYGGARHADGLWEARCVSPVEASEEGCGCVAPGKAECEEVVTLVETKSQMRKEKGVVDVHEDRDDGDVLWVECEDEDTT